MKTKFSRWWVALWAVNMVVLVGLLLSGARVSTFAAAAGPLFLLPEAIGLRRRRDQLPPLTYVIRRYVPRWLVDSTVFAGGAFAAMAWWPDPHRTVVMVTVAFIVGWLLNHFDTTFDGPGE